MSQSDAPARVERAHPVDGHELRALEQQSERAIQLAARAHARVNVPAFRPALDRGTDARIRS